MLTVTVFPAGGALASKSVAILKPLLQQFLVRGPFVQALSGALVDVVAWRSTTTGAAFFGIAPARAIDPSDSQQATLGINILDDRSM
jgi:hypothetical protein